MKELSRSIREVRIEVIEWLLERGLSCLGLFIRLEVGEFFINGSFLVKKKMEVEV